ncbi:FAD-binding and (Fe-S)-binding domain-containing protein [Flavihumibacter sp. CACIAM 22H1]|uniref:FAD-binding and (Fe-S)-binding domain-containing protein n=1 Tax=Flavihumibacter sp. CACIAM 22H1 TaxID=1812911 RepID=UPI0007A8D884|nr:FAD-binding and (Fe-S)-binding domain-containing protein [Flavihumibacter sp. CACIAM 22H1]KYP15751.1 MAG: FAD-binding protein [Flavihumibacter sp. CACIAM 22H1]
MIQELQQLGRQLEGELYYDAAMRTLYATDASAYRELPLAVAIPRHEQDIKTLLAFAKKHHTSLIPRTAGTSLAGQVVGAGIVVDVSRTFTKILELNKEEHWVRVQPGVVRDELNLFLKPHGLFFGPETSTANRAMIGGMVGNNSCGSNSVVYRSTREHLLEVKAILSDGSDAEFKALNLDEFHAKCEGDTLENQIYRRIRSLLSDYANQEEIRREFPKKTVERRNTGYAVDLLLETAPFTAGQPDFNFCTLIAGSEGTLAFLTEIKLNLVPLPPKETGLLCVHFNSIDESLRANLIALKYRPSASELIDHYILECTKQNREQMQNRFFVQGDPGAILVVEFARATRAEIEADAAACEAEMRAAGLGYHFPLLFGADTKKIWTLRKAGLGLLSNLPGDEKAVPVIEDTAVDVEDLPAFIREFNEILAKHGLYSVHYAHAGSGELHLRPIINLKTEEGNRLFRVIAEEIATLVKKYKGSLSGEHGDGRLRGEFIKQMVGEKNYQLLREIKKVWDPKHIFNPNKIVDTPPMDTMLRYTPGQKTPAFKTVFRYYNQDVLQHAEQCNGSGDCRKTHLSGGTMCPSYMATRNEKDTTRARANILREFLTRSEKANRFDHEEIKEVMDLCLSCKACKTECPSNVDMAKLKAEFLQQYYDSNGIPLRSRLIANFSLSAKLGSIAPGLYNFAMTNKLVSKWVKNFAGFALERSMPTLAATTLKAWFKSHSARRGTPTTAQPVGGKKLYLFCDEFTNYNDVEIGKKAILLLERLGYEVVIPEHEESGRSWMSKGLIRHAKGIANRNIARLRPLISDETPLVGIEPSAILTFRDEYIDLAEDDLLEDAQALAQHVYLIDEFIAREISMARISPEAFTKEKRAIKLHGHCQQKAISSVGPSVQLLSLPENYTVETIPSGCCGMAGSFGYEKEHYDISMKVGELVLLPAVRAAGEETIIAAPGTSCRHQIKDGTGRKAKHPVEVLYEALV